MINKQIISSISGILAAGLVLTVSLTSCSKKNSDAPETSAVTTDVVTAKVPQDNNKFEATEQVPVTEEDDSVRVPVNNKNADAVIAYQFGMAKKAADMVITENLAINKDEAYTDEENGVTYYRITDGTTYEILEGKAITTFADLEKYLRGLFVMEIADGFVDEAKLHYRDVDGVLYCEEFKSEEERKMENAEFFLSKFTSKSFRYTAKIKAESNNDGETPDADENKTAGDGYEYRDYIFENNGEGWFWTAFPIF